MRDIHGRYTTTKEIAEFTPEWARGCDACTCGIVLAPELTGAAPLYLERLVQAIDGDITFCTCEAGKAYRVSLLNRRQKLIEEARQDSRMVESARGKTHPDIENARLAMSVVLATRTPTIHAAQAQRVPTVHVEGEKVPA